MTEDDARTEIQASVSRETFERLEIYAQILTKWQKAINLVSKTTIPQIWARHMLDSAQLFDFCDKTRGNWVDIGSGGGFPGLVCAAIAHDSAPGLSFTLIESDARKSAFLRTAASEMGLTVQILNKRIEGADPQDADILSARALAPLNLLCEYAERHLKSDGVAYFQKGENYQSEIDEALATWDMRVELVPSKTASNAVILKIEGLKRA